MKNGKLIAYVGTYTNGESKGIYRLTIDHEKGIIEGSELAAKIGNPTYLAVSKDNRYLFSTAKLSEEGGVAAFSICEDGGLKLINYRVTQENPPCYVSLNREKTLLFSANYHKGSVKIYPINEDGSIEAPSSIITHTGSGPDKDRQEKAHLHYAALTPDEKQLCTVDLGIDRMEVYDIREGLFFKSEESSLSVVPGSGPRHMEFHPGGRFAYLITELSSEVVVLQYMSSDRTFKVVQYISTLPSDYQGENQGSAIHVSLDGRFLYASNRGHDSLAVFKINNLSGMLETVEHVSTEGSFPRDFSIDPSGSFILAANQNTSNITKFLIDRETGKLTHEDTNFNIPNPVCIKFLT